MTRNSKWDDVQPSQFLEHVKEGLSYSQIGAMYGVSRNSVSGKVLRWKERKLLPDAIPGHAPKAVGRARTPQAGKPSSNSRARTVPVTKSQTGALAPAPRAQAAAPQDQSVPVRPRLFTAPIVEMPGVPVGLYDKKDWMCAVVVGRDDKGLPTYCGCRATHNFRMCDFHAKTMLETAVARKQDRAGRRAIAQGEHVG